MRLKFSLLAILVIIIGFWVWMRWLDDRMILDPRGEQVKKELPYEKYSFERLVQRVGTPSEIEVVGNRFYYHSEGRRISGEINIPISLLGDSRKVPIIVMARGYVEKDRYKTGVGTHNAAKYYSEDGYITLAPDFSGYGESDPEDPNALGARLVKPVEILDLIASLDSLPIADLGRIYLWGHSNGGQIMLSVAEILGKRNQESGIRGVTLWAPVSKPFPYNILYYTDDASDSGKWLRSEIAKFEADYNAFDYSIDRYLDWIDIPIQIHQGSADEAVPKKWSDELVNNLKEKDKDVTYYAYPGADHNMKPNWNQVVERDLEFFAN